MATKRISQDKTSRIATIICQNKFDESIKNVKEKIQKVVEEYLKQFVDPVVLKLYNDEKTNCYIKKMKGFYLYDNPKNYLFTIHPNLPKEKPEYSETDFSRDEDLNKLLKDLIKEYQTFISNKQTIRNKVSCVISDIKTYNKLKNEFPEAYDILIKQIDKEVESDDKCTSVEELRAELTSKV